MRNTNFEKWFAKWAGLDLEMVESMWDGTTYQHYRYTVEAAYKGWCAALGFEVQS